MRSLHDFGGPILYGGDFNEVLYLSEIARGAGGEKRSVSDFQELVGDL